MKPWLKYSLFGILFWFIIDFTTTEAIKDAGHYYSTFMPLLLIFYIGYPLIFSLLIYKYEMSDKKIFISTIIAMILLEVLFFRNVMLYSFPMFLLAIPLAVSIYSLLTFGPKWIVEKQIRANKKKFVLMIVVYVLLSLVTAFGSG